MSLYWYNRSLSVPNSEERTLCGLSGDDLTKFSSVQDCLEQDTDVGDEDLYDDFACLEQLENERLDEQFAMQEALMPVGPKPDSCKESRKDARRKHYRRAVLGCHVSAYYFGHYDFVGYKNGHVPPWHSNSLLRDFSRGHGHRNFGRKPRDKHRHPELRKMLQTKWQREADELSNDLAYQEAMWEQCYLSDLECADFGPEDDSDEDASDLPQSAQEYWPEVYTFAFAARFDLGDYFDDPYNDEPGYDADNDPYASLFV